MRDPRSIFHSRLRVQPFLNIQKKFHSAVAGECTKYEQNIDFLMKVQTQRHLLKILQENFIILRHEDMSSHPLLMAQKIYSFVGLEMPETVKEFASANGLVRSWHKPVIQSKEQQPTSTWQDSMEFERILDIQVLCNVTMEVFGYKFVHREDQGNHTTVSYIGKVHKSLPFYNRS